MATQQQGEDDEHVVELPRVSKNVYEESKDSRLNSVVATKSPEAVYKKKNRFVGWTVCTKGDYEQHRARAKARNYESQKGAEFRVRLDKENNAAGLLGPPGTGKTVLLRGISNRGRLAEVPSIHLADVKQDMQSNNEGGVQEENANLRDNEDPQPVSTRMLMPKFIKEYSGDAEDWNEFFWFDFADLDADEFLTMMGATNKTRGPLLELYDLAEEGEVSITGGESDSSGDDVFDWLEDADINYHHRRSIRQNLQNMKRRSVIGSGCELDIPEILAENESFISLNMSGHENVPSGFSQMYIGKTMIDLVQDKKGSSGHMSKSTPVDVYIDEAHEFLSGDNVAEERVRKTIKKRRNLKFRFIWATHRLHDFEGFKKGTTRPDELPEIVTSTNHFFIAPSFGSSSAQVILKHCNVWRTQDTDKWRDIFSWMKDLRDQGIYVWLYVSRDNNDWRIFESASSIARHS